MRRQAITMGLTMNEHGLYNMEGKKKGEKVAHNFKNEKDIFDYLHLEYKAPEDRVDGRSVIVKNTMNQNQNQQTISLNNSSKKTLKKKENKTTKTKTKKNIDLNSPIISNKPNSPIIPNNPIISNKPNSPNNLTNTDPVIIKQMNDFKKNGITYLSQLNETQLVSIMTTANALYYNDTPILTDNEYDIIQEYIKEKYPTLPSLSNVGAPVERNKATLPYHMASMDKIKPDTHALTNWMKKFKGPYVLSCKLDGVSGLFTTEGKDAKLYTRGDGTIGQDVSYLIPYLRLPKTKNIVIRGEFIISKQIFETKYKPQFANPRNLVAGIINHKHVDEKIKDVSFVAYEVIRPVLPPSKQMELLA
jgi:hypothetical protein